MFLKTQVKSIRLISVLQIATWTQTMLHVLQTSHTASHIDIWSPHCICLKNNLNLSGSSTTTHFFFVCLKRTVQFTFHTPSTHIYLAQANKLHTIIVVHVTTACNTWSMVTGCYCWWYHCQMHLWLQVYCRRRAKAFSWREFHKWRQADQLQLTAA